MTQTKEERAVRQREYVVKNHEKVEVYQRGWRKRNRKKRALYGREWRKNNFKKVMAYGKWYRENNHEKAVVYGKEYKKTHRAEMAVYFKKYMKEQYQNNIKFRLAGLLRTRLGKAIKRGGKTGSAVRDLGCTIPELKFYLEGQFQDGMTWDNWTRVDLHEMAWNIDHKIPLSFFDLSDKEQFLQAVHYTNLQPMWAKENIRKYNKVNI